MEFNFNTEHEAYEFIINMIEVIEQYSFATVADARDINGEMPDFNDTTKGWTNLDEIEPVHINEHWVLYLPEPEVL